MLIAKISSCSCLRDTWMLQIVGWWNFGKLHCLAVAAAARLVGSSSFHISLTLCLSADLPSLADLAHAAGDHWIRAKTPKAKQNKKWGKRVKSLETESEAKAAQKPLCSRELSFVSQSGTSCSLSLSLRPSDTAHSWTLFFWSSFHSHSLAEWIALAFFL